MKKIFLASALPFILTACHKEIVLNPPPPPEERLVCKDMPPAPDISPLQAFMVPEGMPVYQKRKVDERDALLAAWILAIRDAHFSCFDNVTWIRQYYAEQAD